MSRLREWLGRIVLVTVSLAVMTVGQLASAETRVALVIGIAAYRNVNALLNPINDAIAMAAALTRDGFTVDLVRNPDKNQLEDAIRRFGDASRGADAALFYYAGHALEWEGRNWLMPVSAKLTNGKSLRYEAVELDSLVEQLDGAARLSMVFLDACRENPFRNGLGEGRGMGGGEGLREPRTAAGMLVAYATAPGRVAADGNGPNSPFTTALLRQIEVPGVEVKQMLTEVRREVREVTHGAQIPWEQSAMDGAFYFHPLDPPRSGGREIGEVEKMFWNSIFPSNDPADFRDYLDKFPHGAFESLARRRLERLSTSTKPVATAILTSPQSTQSLTSPSPRPDAVTAGQGEPAKTLQSSALQVIHPGPSPPNVLVQGTVGAGDPLKVEAGTMPSTGGHDLVTSLVGAVPWWKGDMTLARRYANRPLHKAYAFSLDKQISFSAAADTADEAVQLSLERCHSSALARAAFWRMIMCSSTSLPKAIGSVTICRASITATSLIRR